MKLTVLLLAFGPALFAQTVLEGDVIDAASRAPVSGAIVTVITAEFRRPLATTNASGHFRVSLAQSRYYRIQVSHPGFLTSGVATASSGERPAGFKIELTRQAVISGKLQDEDGFPVERASVEAFPAASVSSLRYSGFTTMSDDRGEYRIANLPAGKYYVRASTGQLSSWDERYWPEFFPGTLEPHQEGVIELAAGQERGGMDIDFTKQEGVTVAGSVVMPDGTAVQRQLTVAMQPTGYQGSHGYGFVRSNNKSFTIPHVAPGTYVLRAQSGRYPPQAGDLYGEQQVAVSGSDLRNVVMPVRVVQPMDLEGVVVSDRGAPPRPLVIGLRLPIGGTKSVRPNEDGSFVFKDLLPGNYYVMISPTFLSADGTPPSLVYTLSVRLGDRDVRRDGFTLNGNPPGALRIVVASAIGTVRGTLLDASGQPVAGGVVMLAPNEGSYSGNSAVTSAKGEFVLTAPPGEYRVYAIAAANQAASIDSSDYMKEHENDFRPLQIVEGEKNLPLTLRLPAAR